MSNVDDPVGETIRPEAAPAPPTAAGEIADIAPAGGRLAEAAPVVDGDGVMWRRPSARLLSARRILLAVVDVPLVVAGGVVGGIEGSVVVGAITAAVLLVAGVVVERFLARRVRAWAFAERVDDLMVRRGVLLRRLSVVPYGRMQYIDVTAGPIERTFGLATLRMHTAAAASDARIPGLDRQVATRLRDQLARLGEARSGGL